jgi:hypothetical protein
MLMPRNSDLPCKFSCFTHFGSSGSSSRSSLEYTWHCSDGYNSISMPMYYIGSPSLVRTPLVCMHKILSSSPLVRNQRRDDTSSAKLAPAGMFSCTGSAGACMMRGAACKSEMTFFHINFH